MLETMYVRCTHCGYDNSPEYRFCGMCGAALAHPPIPAKPSVREVASVPKPSNGNAEAEKSGPSAENVHGPSFLGLSEDPKTEFHYLYEDEPPRSFAGLIFVVILFAAIGGASYWQWKHHGFPFIVSDPRTRQHSSRLLHHRRLHQRWPRHNRRSSRPTSIGQ